MKRSQLASQLEELKPLLETTFSELKSRSDASWYPSVVVERREKRDFSINPRGQNLNDSFSFGWILRVFNGETLFEQAGDDFSAEGLKNGVESLFLQLKSAAPVKSGVAYTSPKWDERLKLDLEDEIRAQIPAQANESTWVHFGVPMEKDLPKGNDQIMNRAKAKYEEWLKYMEAQKSSHYPLDYTAFRWSFEKVDMMFMDASVRMTQSLQRNSATLVGLKQGKQTYCLKGGLGGLETVEVGESEFREVLDRLEKTLTAEKIKPGRYKVLMSPSVTGVFAHEAFGHSQEGDTWARGRSKARELYENQQRVGNDYANIVNNPAVYKNGPDEFAAWGSYYFDEEGWLAQKHMLVEKGYLKNPMTHLISSLRLNVPRTANGKRENWTHGVYTRQTNTYFEPGDKTLEEMLSEIDYGFLATTPFGGMEDPKGMGIQVGMAYVEEIKDGKLTGKSFVAPNGGAIQMTGYVPDYLNRILAVSKIDFNSKDPDKSCHPWNEVGGCGKYHKEYVVAGCGGPYLLVDNVLLG